MSSYIISYDLMAPGKNYSSLFEAISSYTNVKILESCYIIKSSSDETAIRSYLTKYMDSNDRLFIAKLHGTGAWTNALSSNDSIKSII